MNVLLDRSGRAARRVRSRWNAVGHRWAPAFDRVRVGALLLGCGFLFWQHDGTLSDVLFGAGIATSIVMVGRRHGTFDVAWPQVLVLMFVAVTAVATFGAGGSVSSLAITVYLIALSLAMTRVLQERPERLHFVEMALVASGCIAALLICVGYAARQFGWTALDTLSYDAFRGQGLFKDPNTAGAFTALTFPFAAAAATRARRWASVWLVALTAILGAGVVFSFSREALILFAIGVVAVVIILGMLRNIRWMIVLLVSCLVALGSAGALNRLPNYRGYQLVNPYDQYGRLVAWRFGIDMLRSAPLGTGAGSFERRSQQKFDDAMGKATLPGPIDTSGVTRIPVDESAGFHSTNVARPAVLSLGPGAISEPISMSFRNTGTRAWRRGIEGEEARLGIGEAGLVLDGRAGLIARLTDLVDDSGASLAVGWPAAGRVAVQAEPTVVPGAEGTFTFQIRAPGQAGTYTLHLRPVIEGVTWMEDDGVSLEVTVTSTAPGSTVHNPATSVPAPVGGSVTAPAPPGPYALPDGALYVSTSSELVRALAIPTARAIVLSDGVYDSAVPFYDAYGHDLFAATLGGAVLRAGVSLGNNDGRASGSIQGIRFDVSDPSKTLNNAVVNIWGSGAGARVRDVVIDGRKTIPSGILAMPQRDAVIERIAVHDLTEFGVAVLTGEAPGDPVLLEDVNVLGVVRQTSGASNQGGGSCVWLANRATVHRALLRSCGFAGVWTGANNVGSELEHVDIDDASVGLYMDESASHISAVRVHVGSLVSSGVLAAGLVARQPDVASSASGLVVVPSAHNTYIRVAVESGALGFVALLAYLILIFWSLVSSGWRDHWPVQLCLGLALVAGLGIDTLHWRHLWIYIAMAGVVGTRGPLPFDVTVLARAAARVGTIGHARRAHRS